MTSVHHESDSTPDAGDFPEIDLTPRTSSSSGDGSSRSSGRKRGERVAVIAIVAVLVVAGALAVKSLGGATLYFYQANEAVAQKSELGDKRFRLFGNVESNSVQRTGAGVSFAVSYDKVTVPVQHVGDPPQLFQPGIPVVLEGHWSPDGSTFQSDRILVKHTSEYVEKNPDRKTSADTSP